MLVIILNYFTDKINYYRDLLVLLVQNNVTYIGALKWLQTDLENQNGN
jgi:hypothetical protein